MGNTFVDLPIPISNGDGAAQDVSSMGEVKTLNYDGDLQATVQFQVSFDGVNFQTVQSFAAPGKITIRVAALFMRIRVSSFRSGSTANTDVSSNDNGAAGVNLPVPVGIGVGAAVDVRLLGTFNTFVVTGQFGGNIIVEASADGVTFNTCASFGGGVGGLQSKEVVAQFMRVRRNSLGNVPGTPRVDVIASNDAVSPLVPSSNVEFVDRGGIENRIFVRTGGSDTTGDGTLANPYATILRALDDVPAFIVNERYIIDCTGVTELVTTPIRLRPYQSTDTLFFDSSPPYPGLSIRTALTFEADPTVIDTITAPELTGQTQDPVTLLRTLNTTKNLTANQYRGRFVIDANGVTGVIASNTAGPNSDIEVTQDAAFTAPINILEPSCEIRNTAGGNAMIAQNVGCQIQLNGIKLSSSSTSSFTVGLFFDSTEERLGTQFCELDGLFAVAGLGGSTSPSVSNSSIYRRLAGTGVSVALFNCLVWANPAGDVTTCTVALRHTGRGSDTNFWFENIFDGCSTIGGSTGIEDVNSISVSMDKCHVRNGTGDGLFVPAGGMMLVRRTDISSNVGNGITIQGSPRTVLNEVAGTGNGGFGMQASDGAVVKRQSGSSVTVTGTSGDFKLGDNAAATWGAFTGHATDLGAVAPQICLLSDT